jgi:uncharacterized membrane protein
MFEGHSMRKFFAWLKKNILTGIFISAPAVVTIYVFWIVFRFLDGILAGLLVYFFDIKIPGSGFVVLLAILCVLGFLTRSYIGSKFLSLTDAIFTRLPVAKSIYSAIKQIGKFLEIKKTLVFHAPVMIEYPRKGLFVIGLLVNEKPTNINGKNLYPIFISSTPNPTTGFLIFAKKSDFIELDMTIEEAMKMVVSAGILSPTEELINEKSFVETRKGNSLHKTAKVKIEKVINLDND